MALDAVNIFAQAQKLREVTNSPATSDVALQILVDNAMNTAVSAGAYTANCSTAGQTPLNIQNVMNTLKQMGYGVTLVATTLTFTW